MDEILLSATIQIRSGTVYYTIKGVSKLSFYSLWKKKRKLSLSAVLFLVQRVSNLIFGMSVFISSPCLLPSPPLSLALFIYLFYETSLVDVTIGTQCVQNQRRYME